MNKLLLTPKEAAEMLSVSRSKLYELLAAGRFTSVRIDGCRRISVEALRAYVDALGSENNESATEFAARGGSVTLVQRKSYAVAFSCGGAAGRDHGDCSTTRGYAPASGTDRPGPR